MMTVNFQHNSMVLTDKPIPALSADTLLMDDTDFGSCFAALTEGNRNVWVNCKKGYLRRFIQYVRMNYIFVKAAGGIVSDDSGNRLVMIRNGRADLPKGKVEEGETLAVAAMRETNEETGLKNLTLGRLRLKTYHIYNLYGGWHFKQTSWFEMKTTGSQPLVPQTEEGITALEWVGAEEWCRRLAESYSTMRIIAEQICEN